MGRVAYKQKYLDTRFMADDYLAKLKAMSALAKKYEEALHIYGENVYNKLDRIDVEGISELILADHEYVALNCWMKSAHRLTNTYGEIRGFEQLLFKGIPVKSHGKM